MKLVGLAVVLGGWVLAVGGLFITTSNIGRALIACAGIGVTLFGSLVVINGAHLAHAIWKQQH